MKLNRKQLRRLIYESLNEEKKSYPPLKLSDMKNVGENNKDITMEDIKSSMKNTRAIDMAMANKYPDTRATGRFVVEDFDGSGYGSVMKAVQEKYDFEPGSDGTDIKYKSNLFRATIDGKKYYVIIEKVRVPA